MFHHVVGDDWESEPTESFLYVTEKGEKKKSKRKKLKEKQTKKNIELSRFHSIYVRRRKRKLNEKEKEFWRSRPYMV